MLASFLFGRDTKSCPAKTACCSVTQSSVEEDLQSNKPFGGPKVTEV